MAWHHLEITRPHLVYIILGGFTSLFMLCSSVIKERLYIGEATVATLCGIIFGPHAANLINPLDWGNTDLITLEFSRIVLVVQCFAVGVELPKAYMERHWRSLFALLVPVMTFGWLITSLFIWALMGHKLNWLDSLCCAACVTATDPVLASSVVGKGKFAKRVPKHLRDLLSAESGCNDGMAFPFIYLAVYVIRYHHHPEEVSLHWFCYTILYECIFGAVYGVVIGYIARRLIRYAHEHDLIDRESFLVFYFVLALFCAGSGSMLGMDDLLIGFACGVGFSNDGWFLEKTEEAHVSNVIDLLINLAFFVYFGTIIPWETYNDAALGISPWRLVVIGILVLLFRRIPIMVAMKPLIPDIKTWREALFAGHFGPIGVGAIFVAILARAEMEHIVEGGSEPTDEFPSAAENGHLNIITLIWPITTFLVICSILVHGSSIAVFTLGKHINTLTLTLSYTQANEEGPSWMDRLPRIQSRSKSSMSLRRPDETDSSYDEKGEFAPGTLGPLGIPGNFLRRQKDDDTHSRSSSLRPRNRKKWEGVGPGGPISQSAIAPQRRREHDPADLPDQAKTDSEATALNSDESPEEIEKEGRSQSPEEEIYQEGSHTIFEDEEGNVLEVHDSKGQSPEQRAKYAKEEGRRLMRERDIQGGVAQTEDDHKVDEGAKIGHEIKDGVEHPQRHWRDMRHRLQRRHTEGTPPVPNEKEKKKPKRGPALAYQFGNTIIVEDEDGEVIKKYDIPGQQKKQQQQLEGKEVPAGEAGKTRQRLHRMGTLLGMSHEDAKAASQGQVADNGEGPSGTKKAAKAAEREEKKKKRIKEEESDDEHIRFTVNAGGQRMSKAEFIAQIQKMDPKARAKMVENSNVPDSVKKEARADAREATGSSKQPEQRQTKAKDGEEQGQAVVRSVGSDERERRPTGPDGLMLIDSDDEEIPFHNIHDDLEAHETGAAQRRRRLAEKSQSQSQSQSTTPTRGGSPSRRPVAAAGRTEKGDKLRAPATHLAEGETAAERRRREGALGLGSGAHDSESESEEEDVGKGIRKPPAETKRGREKLEQRDSAERERRDLQLKQAQAASEEKEMKDVAASAAAAGDEVDDDGHDEHENENENENDEHDEGRSRTPGIRFAEPARPPPAAGQEESHHHRRRSSGLRWGRDVGRGRK
ncbi:uncharacterized protein K452DRAFT_233609 [Aplosporella prunicola CBS 121167]|uniref:Na(+)/H(+) antiporter n=1 Tax=Aplosporella prunicola CBS 121167 TaxID=1176127 RepID=A0A6A6B4S3_9PEZI|nr:uncharacterized protein K452DRAFT_233609 [Aplosporella prunicola CBS 121167]KAF2138856.1 hypothetical protein K452DRAFT_233609 [Aplosporella prunicola CBS 121167]